MMKTPIRGKVGYNKTKKFHPNQVSVPIYKTYIYRERERDFTKLVG